jgi:hypothetical protein
MKGSVKDMARKDVRVERIRPEQIRAVRIGHGANCSSIGSVIDTLFVGALMGGAILAAVAAALSREPITVVGRDSRPKDNEDGPNKHGADTPKADKTDGVP